MLIAIMGLLAFTLLNVMYKVTRTHVLGILLFDWLTGMGQLLCILELLKLNGFNNPIVHIGIGIVFMLIMSVIENSIVNKIKES